MKKGLMTIEAIVIIGGFIAILVVIGFLLVSYMYKPPTPLSQQIGDCAMRGGIKLERYDRLAEDAKDASKYIRVIYRNKKVSPCSVNGELDSIYDSCVIGEKDNVRVEVNMNNCNLADIKQEQPVNETTNSSE